MFTWACLVIDPVVAPFSLPTPSSPTSISTSAGSEPGNATLGANCTARHSSRYDCKTQESKVCKALCASARGRGSAQVVVLVVLAAGPHLDDLPNISQGEHMREHNSRYPTTKSTVGVVSAIVPSILCAVPRIAPTASLPYRTIGVGRASLCTRRCKRRRIMTILGMCRTMPSVPRLCNSIPRCLPRRCHYICRDNHIRNIPSQTEVCGRLPARLFPNAVSGPYLAHTKSAAHESFRTCEVGVPSSRNGNMYMSNGAVTTPAAIMPDRTIPSQFSFAGSSGAESAATFSAAGVLSFSMPLLPKHATSINHTT